MRALRDEGLRFVLSIAVGALASAMLGCDPEGVAVVAALCTMTVAGRLQERLDDPRALSGLINLPLPDTWGFDRILLQSVLRTLGLFGAALGALLVSAFQEGCPLLPAVGIATTCAALIWAGGLSVAAILAAGLPRAPLQAAALLGAGLLIFSPPAWFRAMGDSALSLPAGWAVRIFFAAVHDGVFEAHLAALSLLTMLAGAASLAWMRRTYQLPEAVWRRLPAEVVVEYLVREETAALARTDAGGALAPEGARSEVLRGRAERNVDVSIRTAVSRGAWRTMTRPGGTVERLLWRLLPFEHRALSPFVVPMGRGVTEGLQGAALLCAVALFPGGFEESLPFQFLVGGLVLGLCLLPGRASGLAPCVLEGALPVDPAALMWIALEVAALRVALWTPFLLLQAAALQHDGVLPGAVGMALRLIMLVLTLQPLMAVLQVGGASEDATVDGRGFGLLASSLAAPAVVLAATALVVIASEPAYAEAPLVALTGLVSFATFVLHGLRLACIEPPA